MSKEYGKYYWIGLALWVIPMLLFGALSLLISRWFMVGMLAVLLTVKPLATWAAHHV